MSLERARLLNFQEEHKTEVSLLIASIFNYYQIRHARYAKGEHKGEDSSSEDKFSMPNHG